MPKHWKLAITAGDQGISGISLIDEAGAKYRTEWVIKRWWTGKPLLSKLDVPRWLGT